MDLAQKEVDSTGVTLELATVSNSSEVQTASEASLSRGIETFLAISDNTLAPGFEAMAQVGKDNSIPVVGTSASFPARGAVASFGIDPYQKELDSGAQ